MPAIINDDGVSPNDGRTEPNAHGAESVDMVMIRMECSMESTQRFTIRQLLIATIVVAVLWAIPLHAHRVSLPIPFLFWCSLGYNALVLAAIAYPVYRLLNRPRIIVTVCAALYLLNFMPEVATAIDFSVTGNNDATGYWLADHGLDYDPLVCIPCHFDRPESG